MHTFLQKCSPTLRIFGVFKAKKPESLLTWHTFGVFHPFCVNKKLKTHLREHSRQSPVPKIRSCFLSEFSGIVRTCFFFFLWFAFFLLFQKKEERNERKNKVVLFYTNHSSYTNQIFARRRLPATIKDYEIYLRSRFTHSFRNFRLLKRRSAERRAYFAVRS